MYLLLTIVGLVVSASAKDLIVGQEGGRIIFEQNVTASPALWTQERTIIINATKTDVITRIVVIDNREDKNGEAAILEGGEGHKNVTILLKGPSVFRELNFTVIVYAKPEDQRPREDDQQTVQKPSEDHRENDKQSPKVNDGVHKSTEDNQTPKTLDGVKPPLVATKQNEGQVHEKRETFEQKPVIPIPSEKDNQNTKTGEKEQNDKEPKTMNGDQQAVIDEIFGEDNSSVQAEVKPGQPIDNDAALNPKEVAGQKPMDTPTTSKVINGQQIVKTEQDFHKTKEQPATAVPLPYVKHL